VKRCQKKRGLVAHPPPSGERQFRYRPVLSMAAAERSPLDDLLIRVFEGRPARLLARLLEDERMTVRDLCDMRCVLEEALSAYAPAFEEAARVLSMSDQANPLPEEARGAAVAHEAVPPALDVSIRAEMPPPALP